MSFVDVYSKCALQWFCCGSTFLQQHLPVNFSALGSAGRGPEGGVHHRSSSGNVELICILGTSAAFVAAPLLRARSLFVETAGSTDPFLRKRRSRDDDGTGPAAIRHDERRGRGGHVARAAVRPEPELREAARARAGSQH